MDLPIKILIVEDRLSDVELILRKLHKAGINPDYKVVMTEDEYNGALLEPVDLILCDHNLPAFDSETALKILQDKEEIDIPFIIVSGDMDEDVVLDMMKKGATDHLHKDRLGRLGAAVIAALKQKSIREDFKKLISQKTAILDASLDAIISIDHKGVILQWNKAAEDIFGFKSSEVIGKPLVQTIIPTRLRQRHLNGLESFLKTGRSKILGEKQQMPAIRSDGKEIQVELFVQASNDSEYPPIFTASARDLGDKLRAEDIIKKNEARLRQVIEAAPNGLIMVDKTGTIVLCNAETEKLFHYQKEELIGKSIDVLVPDEYKESHPKFRNAFFKIPETRQMGSGRDLFGLRKDGVEIPVEIGLNPLFTEDGVFVLASVVDITERKQVETKIKQERDKVVKILDLNTDGWWDWNLKNPNEDYLSPSFKNLVGYGENELGNSSEAWKKLIFPEDLKIADQNFKKHLRTGGRHPYYQKIRFKHKSGSTIWMVCKGVALKDDRGNWERMIGVHFDITNIMELEQKLRDTNKELESKNQEMEQFVYTVSHDLKSPLVTSAGFLGFLEQDIAKKRFDQVEDSISRLKRANLRMEQLIDDLLQLSRVGRLKLKIEEIDGSHLVKTVLENIKGRVKEEGIEIKVQESLPKFFGDKDRVYQAFENLIINALKYGCTPESNKIEIGSEIERDFVKFYIKDFGPGIEPEYHEKIFGLFQRLERSPSKGTGVGLAIVSRIMQLHHGQTWVESDQGKGATFWMRFPKNIIQREETDKYEW